MNEAVEAFPSIHLKSKIYESINDICGIHKTECKEAA